MSVQKHLSIDEYIEEYESIEDELEKLRNRLEKLKKIKIDYVSVDYDPDDDWTPQDDEEEHELDQEMMEADIEELEQELETLKTQTTIPAIVSQKHTNTKKKHIDSLIHELTIKALEDMKKSSHKNTKPNSDYNLGAMIFAIIAGAILPYIIIFVIVWALW